MKQLILVLFLCIPFLTRSQEPSSHYLRFSKGELSNFLHYDSERIPMVSAHRGGRFIKGYPENAIPTFEYVLAQSPAIIEFDVMMTKDSVLFLLHDNSLDRTTNGTGKVINKNWRDIKGLYLVDDFGVETSFHPPTFKEALQWAKHKTILSVDVKKGVPYEKVIQMIEKEQMEEYVIIITYSANAAKKVYELNPNLMISASIRNVDEWERMKATGIPSKNLIAFTGTREPSPGLYQTLHKEGILCILGTLGNLDKQVKARGLERYQTFIEKGADILATDFPLEAHKAISPIVNTKSPKMRFYKKH